MGDCCASCGVQFGDNVPKTEKIQSTWKKEDVEGTEDKDKDTHSVPVLEALRIVFQVPPMQLKDPDLTTEDLLDVDKCLFKEEGDLGLALDLCLACGECLALLYNSLRHFVHLVKLEGELGKRLMELGQMRVQKQMSKTRRKKCGRIKRSREGLPLGFGTSAGGTYSGLVSPGGSEVANEEDDFSSPDSPVNLDDEGPRSPRPKRKSAANKDWALYFKEEEDDDFMEEDEETFGDDGGETEITMTEAEGDDNDDEDDGQCEEGVEASVAVKTEVEVKDEGEEIEAPEDDLDSDEEYRPDSDLENLNQGSPSKKAKTSRFSKTLSKIKRKGMEAFVCEDCGQIFAHESSLINHRRTHSGKECLCAACDQVFPTEDYLRRHRRQFHGEYIPYRSRRNDVDVQALIELGRKIECPVCHGLFPQSDLQIHVDEHKLEKPWNCSECSNSFATLVEFNRHKAISHAQKKTKEKCSVCETQFRSMYHLRRHQLVVHHARSDLSVEENEEQLNEEDRRKKFKCPECDKRYVVLDRLTEHLILHGIGDKFVCKECGREFLHESSRQRHMLLHSQSFQWKCYEDDCDKEFSRKDHLMRHLEHSHGLKLSQGHVFRLFEVGPKAPKAREVPCPLCSKMVKRERLRMHLVTHTGEKRHVCETCGQRFGLRSSLKTHIKCIHQNVRRYKCEHCEKAFKRSNHLKDHMKLHTNPESKPFNCDHCDKSFRRMKNLKSHLVTHTGEKDFVCHQCGKAFSRNDNLKAHVKTVHEGLQIRKRRASSKPPSNPVKPTSKKIVASKREPQTVTQGDIVAEPSLVVSSKEISAVKSSTVVGEPKTLNPPRKALRPYPGKKRVPTKQKGVASVSSKQESATISSADQQTDSNTSTPAPGHIQVPSSSGAILTLVDPNSLGNVAEALGLGTVQIESEEDGQRPTILELAPGTSTDQFQTTYYYYHSQ